MLPKAVLTDLRSTLRTCAKFTGICRVFTASTSKTDVTRVQSATQWTASVHTLHMPKPDVTRVQSATQWTASVHTLQVASS